MANPRVCPRCGSEAGQNEYCSTCGLHLWEEPELPTRKEWEQLSDPRRTAAEFEPSAFCHRVDPAYTPICFTDWASGATEERQFRLEWMQQKAGNE